MAGVLSGFFIVWSIIAVGWAVGRTGVLGDGDLARFVLNRTTFFIASPALVLLSLLDSEPADLLRAPMAVAAIAGLSTGCIVFAALRLFTNRGAADVAVAAISGSVANGANMGFPIATYVLGSPAHALPVILFQQALYTPVYLFVLHTLTSGRRPDLRGVVAGVIGNPTIIASVLGIALVSARAPIPDLLLEPLRALASFAIPGMLLAFGISLIGSAPLSRDAGYRRLTLLATAAKLVLMPTIALGAGLALGLRSEALFAVVVMAALPTAQNVFVAASRFRTGEILARDTVLVTTVGTVLVLLGVSALLG